MKTNDKKNKKGAAGARNFLTPVTRTTLTADVCREMVSHLIRGDWSVGEQIPPERELCVQLGVGRASLREAMKALEIMGMIETRLGDGTYVCHRSEFLSRPLLWAITGSALSEVHELVEARCLIEMGTAGFAADRATGEDLKEIGDHLDRMEASLNDVTAFREADIGFHLAVAQAAHNQILLNALLLIRNLMQKWIDETSRQPGVAAQALDQHKQIFLGVAKRNPERARAAMRHHLDEMARYLQEAQKEAAASVDAVAVAEE